MDKTFFGVNIIVRLKRHRPLGDLRVVIYIGFSIGKGFLCLKSTLPAR